MERLFVALEKNRNVKGNELGHKMRREDKSKMSFIIGYCREKYEHSRTQIRM